MSFAFAGFGRTAAILLRRAVRRFAFTQMRDETEAGQAADKRNKADQSDPESAFGRHADPDQGDTGNDTDDPVQLTDILFEHGQPP
jgi:hypothetical protein